MIPIMKLGGQDSPLVVDQYSWFLTSSFTESDQFHVRSTPRLILRAHAYYALRLCSGDEASASIYSILEKKRTAVFRLGPANCETQPQLKRSELWLYDFDSQMLQQALADLRRAYINFFQRRAKFPRFKTKKRSRLGFRIPQRVRVEDERVYVPSVGWIRIRQSQAIEFPTKR